MAHLIIAVGGAAFAVLVCALGLAGLLAARRAGRAETRVGELLVELAAEQKTATELRGALHDLQAANSAWYRLLRPQSLDTTRPINGGVITISTTAGTMQIVWAQNTANASNTTIHAGSYLRVL